MTMTALDRKVALLRKGVTMSDIARALVPPVTPQQVSMVVSGRRDSKRVRSAVAAVIGQPVARVFPKAA